MEASRMTVVEGSTSDSRSAEHTAHGVAQSRGLFDREILRDAFIGAVRKLDPRIQIKNPVMFVVLVGTVVVFVEAMPTRVSSPRRSRSGSCSPSYLPTL